MPTGGHGCAPGTLYLQKQVGGWAVTSVDSALNEGQWSVGWAWRSKDRHRRQSPRASSICPVASSKQNPLRSGCRRQREGPFLPPSDVYGRHSGRRQGGAPPGRSHRHTWAPTDHEAQAKRQLPEASDQRRGPRARGRGGPPGVGLSQGAGAGAAQAAAKELRGRAGGRFWGRRLRNERTN